VARDVEVNLTASDRTGTALASAERNFKRTNDRIKRQNDKLGDEMGKSLSKEFTGVTAKLTSGFAKAFSDVSGAAVPILAGIGVAASPLIGASISGAIIGGAGIGGVIGGVLLAAKDSRVQAAGKELGKNLLGQLEQDAAVFIGPVLDSISQIGSAFDYLDGNIRSIFASAARYVQPLTDGLIDFIRPVLQGFDKLVAKAAPVIEAIKQGFGEVGRAIGDVFESLSDDGISAALAIASVFKIIATTIRVVGAVVNALTEAFGFLAEVADKFGFLTDEGKAKLAAFKGANDAMNTSVNTTKFAFDAAGKSVQGASEQFQAATTQSDQLADAVAGAAQKSRDLAAAHHSLFDTTTSAFEAMDRLKQSIKENGKTLDVHTEKGRANRTALSGLAAALNADYDAYVKVNGEGRSANIVASQNYNAFIKAATGAGISKKAAHDYARQLGLIPPKKQTDMVANTHDAAARIAALKAQLDSLHDRTIRVTIRSTGNVHVAGPGGSGTQLKGFDASSTWEGSGGGGRSRTGGPAQVSATVENTILLDGRPFRAWTDQRIAAASDRQAWRAKVGRR
jgi:ABC-type transporter Mla subunit MlaD